ncbi:MAG TPA: ribonucleotide-diphosphate reductase subunit beta [Nitrosopumilaceae archaeon]|nr:ribonucleotide-diphosphate reductase subunit beta [Nitrosopumilaceae archaeon]
MHSIILTELGIGVFEDQKCLKSFPFSDPVKNYISIKDGKSKVTELVDYLSEVSTGVQTNNNSLYSILKRTSIDVQLMSNEDMEKIQISKPELLIEAGFAKDTSDAMTKLRDFAMQLSSSKVSEVSESPDLHIIQSINSLDEIDRIINGISSRLREWYGLHFPELDNVIDSILGYSQIVLAGKRDNLSDKVYEDAGFPDSKVEMLSVIAKKSRGGDISAENLSIVQTLAKQIIELSELRKRLEDHVQTQMTQVAPNLSAVLGTAVGARILARAGSLKRLATMPASTIQVLGAEKALFRSLKTGSQPPKHGLLFQHAMVHAAPRWQRGKIARAVAAKAAIAARVDVYGGELNTTLLEKLNVRVEEISKKYKNPVPRELKKDDRPKMDFRSKRDHKPNRDFKGKGKKKKFKMKGKKRKKFGRR